MDSFSPYTTIHGGTEDVPGSGLKTDKSTSFHNTGEKLDTRWAGPFNYTRATDKIKLGPLDLDNARLSMLEPLSHIDDSLHECQE